jgi:hypothetical protein
MMAVESKEWERLVQNWDTIEGLYREEFPTGNAPKCFAAIRELLEK